jgi:hypothetical protein
LTSLSDVRTSISSVGRALGYGTIRLISSSGAAGEGRFTTVHNVEAFKIHILEQKAGLAARPTEPPADDSALGPPQPVASAVTALDTVEVLERLVKLKDAGAITPEEYDGKKAHFLNRLA